MAKVIQFQILRRKNNPDQYGITCINVNGMVKI